MKKVLMSVMVIAVAIGLVASASGAWFSDTEQSTGNVMTAGTVDIEVDGENPWTKTYTGELSDMKPCDTKYIDFEITNVGNNPVDAWKLIAITEQTGGANVYNGASSEPEYDEGLDDSGTYVERCNIASFIIYDLYVDGGEVIHEDQQVRLDNVDGVYIYLGTLNAGKSMTIKQSYHLMAWNDAGQEITNWPQGDKLTFDITLYAEQVSGQAPGPIVASGELNLTQKDLTTWVPYRNTAVVTYSYAGGVLSGTYTGPSGYTLIY